MDGEGGVDCEDPSFALELPAAPEPEDNEPYDAPEALPSAPDALPSAPVAEASADPREFAIALDTSQGARLGIVVDHEDGRTLLIESITEGLVQDWNASHPDLQVRPGDRIMEVNGVRHDVVRIVGECKQYHTLAMLILPGAGLPAATPEATDVRAAALAQGGEFGIVLDRTGGVRLGIDVCLIGRHDLLVEAIHVGLVQAWNRANPGARVVENDCIVEVNGVRGDEKLLAEECTREAVLRMKICPGGSRPAEVREAAPPPVAAPPPATCVREEPPRLPTQSIAPVAALQPVYDGGFGRGSGDAPFSVLPDMPFAAEEPGVGDDGTRL